MLPTHTSASELLNAIGSGEPSDDVSLTSPSDNICDMNNISGPSIVTTQQPQIIGSLPMRRPTALALDPIDTEAAKIIGRISSDGISSNIPTRDQNQKHINIAFNNVSYTVNAGVMRRGE